MRVAYSINGDDIVFGCGEGWVDFAVRNDAPDLVEPAPDRTIWSYIASAEVRSVWKLVIARVREQGGVLHLSFRCDAPAARRWFDMTITAAAHDEVRFETVLTREEPREAVMLLQADQPRDPSAPLLRVCSWCSRCHDDVEWVHIEALLQARPSLLTATRFPSITHGICPACVADLLGETGA